MFSGDVRLHISLVKDYPHLDDFFQYLNSIHHLNIVFYSWTDKTGVVIFIHIDEPVQLVDRLHKIPLVNYISKIKKKDIHLELNGKYSEIIYVIQRTLKEGILVI